MDNAILEKLLQKYLLGTADEVEVQQLMEWYNSFDDEMVIVKTASLDEEKELYERLHSKVDGILGGQLNNKPPVIKLERKHRYWEVAAAFIILLMGLWFGRSYLPKNEEHVQVAERIIQPGQEGAILTLADGKKIYLDSSKNGNIATEGSGTVIKKGAQVIYAPVNSVANAPITYNTMSTPKGREFELILPDNTKVWLNAASSIKFPTAFNNQPRIVEDSGEAYFEVAHQMDNKGKRVPFIVHTSKMTIQVLGTHFDVNAYGDEPYTRTTLLEGSVAASKIGSDKIIKIVPGEQAFISNGASDEMNVRQVDVNKAVAWKNGLFQFDDDQLQAILRQVSRWYNVDIECAEQKKDLRFNGIISKRSNVKSILDLLSATGVVNFKMENGKLIAY
ncbi:FecR family protein [Arachidicoccus sp.]|uniref:FecR family protein n=1 Tax=Arachidicoccus sp. TaxID=1872624 RepID=UPI003D1AF34D